MAFVPVEIDGATLAFRQNADNLFNSPTPLGNAANRQLFKQGSFLYALLDANNFNGVANMYKSTNNGTTWIAQDPTHAPGNANGMLGHVKAFQRGSLIYTAWVQKPLIPTMFVIQSYNTVGDLWNIATAPGPNNITSTTKTHLVVLSTGDCFIFGNGGSGVAVSFIKFSSAAVWDAGWTNINTAVAGVTPNVMAVHVDSSDRMHVIYQEVSAGSSILKYAQVSPLSVVTLIATISTGTAPDGFYVGEIAEWTLKLVVPFGNVADNVTKVLLGSPISAPVFTPTTVDTGASTIPVGGRLSDPTCFVDLAGNLEVFWTANSATGTNDISWNSVNTGGLFSAPAQFYNNATNPAPSQFQPSIQAMSSPVDLGGGKIAFIFDVVTVNNNGTNFFGIFPPAAPTRVSVDPASLATQLLGTGIGVICRFGRPHRCKQTSQVLMIGKDLVRWPKSRLTKLTS